MPDDGGLARLVDASAILSVEQQAHIAALHGQDTWGVDPGAATVTLTAPDGRALVCRAHLLGTSAPGPRTWLWGWRNINGFADGFVALAERVRAAGEEQGVPELTTAELPLSDELPRRLTIAAKTLTGLPMHSSAAIGGGSKAWLLLEHPDLELPPPTARAAADAILAAVETVELADHPEALAAWAHRRGVPMGDGTGAVRLSLPDGDVVVTFDDRRRIVQVEEQEPPGLDPVSALQSAGRREHEAEPPATSERTPGPALGSGLQPGTAVDAPESPVRRLLGFLRGPKP